MEILFLWIRDYRNIKEQSYNFSNEYLFHLKNLEENCFELDISRNPDYIPNFFNNEYIRNLTGIIGQNGSGKTNVLDFIKENFSSSATGVKHEYIVFIRKDEIHELDSYDDLHRFYAPIDYQFTFSNETELALQELFVRQIYNIEENNSEPLLPVYDAFLNSTILFYSNIFDSKPEYEPNGLKNLSTNWLLTKEEGEITNYERQNNSSKNTHGYQELLRNIDFLAGEVDLKHLPFNLPDRLRIDFTGDDLAIVNRSLKENDYPVIRLINEFLNSKHSPRKNYFENSLYCFTYLNVIRTMVEFDQNVKSTGEFYRERIKDPLVESNSLAYQLLIALKNFELYPNTFFADRAKDAIAFLNYFDHLLNIGNIQISENASSATISIKENLPELRKLLRLYMITKAYTNFLHFEWHALSSGEQSMLTLFSRFYSISEFKVRSEDEKIKNNLLIIIDEGDLYFHPEWQRRFVDTLLNFFPEVFKGKKMQIILTSNSPFIASDLPKGNLIFIGKNNNVLPKLNNRENTFAANINSLLADGFFMENGVIGEFAHKKLTRLLKRIEGGKDPNPDLLLREIKILGEPLLADRLESMFHDNYPFYRGDNIEEFVRNLEDQLLAARELLRKRNEGNQ